MSQRTIKLGLIPKRRDAPDTPDEHPLERYPDLRIVEIRDNEEKKQYIRDFFVEKVDEQHLEETFDIVNNKELDGTTLDLSDIEIRNFTGFRQGNLLLALRYRYKNSPFTDLKLPGNLNEIMGKGLSIFLPEIFRNSQRQKESGFPIRAAPEMRAPRQTEQKAPQPEIPVIKQTSQPRPETPQKVEQAPMTLPSQRPKQKHVHLDRHQFPTNSFIEDFFEIFSADDITKTVGFYDDNACFSLTVSPKSIKKDPHFAFLSNFARNLFEKDQNMLIGADAVSRIMEILSLEKPFEKSSILSSVVAEGIYSVVVSGIAKLKDGFEVLFDRTLTLVDIGETFMILSDQIHFSD